MDHSLNYSSRGRVVPAPKNQSVSDEESGWTAYLEDFSKGIEQSHCSSLDGSSLLSDAASSAARNWKLSHHNHPNPPKKLSFKKARTKHISKDDPLEDTASSPVNSPKVRDSNPTEIISMARKVDDHLEGSMDGKGSTSSEHYSDWQKDDKYEQKFDRKNIDCTDFKKRGLCLVPLSLMVNYLG